MHTHPGRPSACGCVSVAPMSARGPLRGHDTLEITALLVNCCIKLPVSRQQGTHTTINSISCGSAAPQGAHISAALLALQQDAQKNFMHVHRPAKGQPCPAAQCLHESVSGHEGVSGPAATPAAAAAGTCSSSCPPARQQIQTQIQTQKILVTPVKHLVTPRAHAGSRGRRACARAHPYRCPHLRLRWRPR